MTSATTSLLGSLLRIENLMSCGICHGLIRGARTLNECGHRFCFDCIYDRLGSERKCPTCKLPAIVKNLRPDPMHDTLVACVEKLKITVAPPMASFEEPTFSGPGSYGAALSTSAPNAVPLEEPALGLPDIPRQKRTSASMDPKSSGSGSTDDHVEQANVDLAIRGKQILTGHQSTLPSSGIGDDEDGAADIIKALLRHADLPDDERPPQENHDIRRPAAGLPPQPFDTTHKPISSYNSMSTITDLGALFKESDLPDDEKTQRLKTAIVHRRDGGPGKPELMDVQPGPSSKRLRTSTEDASSPRPPSFSPSVTELSTSRRGDQSQSAPDTATPKRKTCLSHDQNGVATNVLQQGRPTPPPAALEAYASLTSASLTTETELPSFQNEDLPTLQQEHYSGAFSGTPIHLMFTGLSDIESQECVDLLAASGMHVELCLDMKQFDEISHLVTGKDEKGLSPRTEKYLRGILAGKWIVDRSWVIESCRAGKWLSEDGFEVIGDAVVGKTFGPRRGRLGQNQELLFGGLRFCFFGKRYPNRELIMLLCRAAGGDVLSRRPPGPHHQNEDQPMWTGSNNDDHALENDVVDPKQPIIVIDDSKQLTTKAGKSLAHCQVRTASWMLNCISRFQHPVWNISACTN